MNAIMILHPYKHNGMWVFDDEARGLVKEPFVCGIPEMIDVMVKDIPKAKKGFNLIISADAFPKYQGFLDLASADNYGGHWYRWEAKKMEGWLCPALLKFFAAAPDRIYFLAQPKTK